MRFLLPLFLFWQSTAFANVCDRSEDMIKLLEKRIGKTCAKITSKDLREIDRLMYCGDISSIEPKEISINDFVGLVNLKKLTICQGSLSYIDPEVFRDLTNLEVLQFFSLRIEKFPSGQFKFLTGLRTLDVAQIPLKIVSPDALEGLSKLESLYFINFGAETDVEVPKEFLKHVPSLKTLWYGHAPGIKKMPPGFLRYTKGIENLFVGWLNLKGSEDEILELPALKYFRNDNVIKTPNFLERLSQARPGIKIESNPKSEN